MATISFDDTTALVTLFTGQSIANDAREGIDHDNSSDLDLYGDLFLDLTFSSITGIAAGDAVFEVYLLPEDGAAAGAEFPEGGDGTTGDDVDPQAIYLIGVVETRQPSTSVAEVIGLPGVTLPPRNMRFVVKNVSGQTATVEMRLKKYKLKTTA